MIFIIFFFLKDFFCFAKVILSLKNDFYSEMVSDSTLFEEFFDEIKELIFAAKKHRKNCKKMANILLLKTENFDCLSKKCLK